MYRLMSEQYTHHNISLLKNANQQLSFPSQDSKISDHKSNTESLKYPKSN